MHERMDIRHTFNAEQKKLYDNVKPYNRSKADLMLIIAK